MPMGDGTGPMGNRMFGRGLGPCGRGFRRGFRYFNQPLELSNEQKKKVLEAIQNGEKALSMIHEIEL